MAIQENLTLNGLALNDETNFSLEAVDMTPPKKKPEWAQSADADGADLIRTPLFDNRTITATIRVGPMETMNLALAKLGELVDMLQEAEKNPGGIALEWTPANSTKTITFYVLTGEVTGVPIVREGSTAGYLAAAPVVTIAMTCKPFGYGAEVEGAAAKSIETGLSIVTLTVPTVGGDVPAEGRLVIKDTATVGRRFVEWGIENRYYNASTSLVLDSEDMTPVGGTQSTALNSLGAYKRAGATKGSILTTLLPEPTICCSTGVLKHIGTFRVKARVVAVLPEDESVPQHIHARLSWQDGEGPLRANAWQTPTAGGLFVELDLGVISVTPAQTGSQKWLGQIEAYSEGKAAVDSLHVDYLTFIPVAEGYGKARGIRSSAPGTVVAYDEFATGTLTGNLNARTSDLGAAWATSGSTTDFAVTPGRAERSTTSDSGPRFAVLGTTFTNMQVRSKFTKGAGGLATRAVIARWTNSSNYAAFLHVDGVTTTTLQLVTVVAGVSTVLATGTLPERSQGVISLAATTDGLLTAVFTTSASHAVTTLAGISTAIATGGALATGKGGMYDYNPVVTAGGRAMDELEVTQLPGIPFCIQPSRTMEVRSDSTIAADATGTYFGPVPQYRGSRFYVPQDGEANRTSRIIVKADRNDLQEADQTTIADAFTAQPWITPRYHVIPR